MEPTFYGGTHAACAALYLMAATAAWLRLRHTRGSTLATASCHVSLVLALILHGLALWQDVFGEGVFQFGFAQDLSATLLLAACLLWLEGWFTPLRAMVVMVAPLGAIAALLPMAFHGAPLYDSLALRVHLLVSVMAYGLLMIAALNSLLMAALDRHLHQPARSTSALIATLLDHMPSVLALETLLFRQIAFGFVLLSATLLTGAVFSEERYGHWLRFNHMTVFAVLSWGVFGGLLIGRHFAGWRGRVAQRWVLFGFTTLMLAYIGARFVLEVILGRLPA